MPNAHTIASTTPEAPSRWPVTDFVELHGDRFFGDDKAMPAGIGLIGGHRCVIIGQQKGRDVKENVLRLPNAAPIEAFKQRGELRRRQPHHAIFDLRPTKGALFEPLGDGLQTHFGIGLALWASQVAGQHQTGALLQGVLDGGERGLDPLVAADFLPARRQRDVKVNSDEEALVLQIQIANR